MNKMITAVSALAMASLLGSAMAANIPLYTSPDTTSSVATKVASGERLIPIYRSEQHQGWLKVADPSNGKVGWLHVAQQRLVEKPFSKKQATAPRLPAAPMAKKDQSAAKTTIKVEKQPAGFVKRTITTESDDGKKTYQIIEYSGSEKLDNQQVQKLVQGMQARNRQMQHDMHRMMQDMQDNFFGFQPIMPPAVERIVVVPVEADQANNHPEKREKKSLWHRIKDKMS